MTRDLDQPEDEWAEPPPTMDARGEAATAPAISDTVPVGTVFGGRYRVTGVLGEGGFGVVFDAEHTELGNRVALKVLKKELTQDATLFKRFQQEARTAAAIGHPNIVQVFDLGMDDHGAYIAMEKLEGEELGQRADREHPLSEAYITRIGAEVADAIAAAHDAGVVHRDLKPQNVFVIPQKRRDDAVRVIDFGIAKLLRRVDEDLTKTGQLFGTPRYMAPEQLRGGKHVDGRADIYAMGALLYRITTNAYPFDGESYPELLLKIMADEPEPIASFRPDIGAPLVAIIERAMAKSPEDRFATAREMADALYDHLPNARTEPPTELPKHEDTRVASTSSVSLDGSAPITASALPTSRVHPLALAGGVAVALVAFGALGVLVLDVGEGREARPAPIQSPASGDGAGETRDVDTDPDEGRRTREAPPDEAPRDEVGAVGAGVDVVPPSELPRTVRVVSAPPGARIRVAGAAACVAPCEVMIDRLPIVLTAERHGYRTAEQALSAPLPAEVSLVLEARQARPHHPPPAPLPALETP